jgi:hypothetical protein
MPVFDPDRPDAHLDTALEQIDRQGEPDVPAGWEVSYVGAKFIIATKDGRTKYFPKTGRG